MRMQLPGSQQKHPATAALKVQPDEWKVPERSSHGRFRVTDFDDEKAVGPQIPPGFPQNDPHGIQAGPSGCERNSRLVPIFGRQGPHLARADVGRIRDNDIVGLRLYV
jgi:hypothetical protein